MLPQTSQYRFIHGLMLWYSLFSYLFSLYGPLLIIYYSDPTSNELFLVMEFMQQGSLHDVLHNSAISFTYTLQLHIAYPTQE